MIRAMVKWAWGMGRENERLWNSSRSDRPNDQSLPKHYQLVLSPHYGDIILSSPSTREMISLMEA